MEELVSVIIPVYNRQKTISRAIDSVLGQTYTNIEVIVVDDGSCDDTMKILKGYSDSRIRIFSQEHKGACAARNQGIDEAKGMYIAFQDSDDEWMPEKLCKQLSYMKKNHLKVCYCPYLLYGSEIKTIPEDYLLKEKYQDNIEATLKSGNAISTQTLVLEKGVFDEVGKFDDEMPRLQDYELVIRIVQQYKVGYYAESLVKVYRQRFCISNDGKAYKEAVYQLIKKHRNFFNYENMQSLFFSVIEYLKEDDIDYVLKLQKISGVSLVDVLTGVIKMYLPLFSLFKLQQKQQYIKFEKKLCTGEFAIYGAGIYAKRVFNILQGKNLRPKSFLVTALLETEKYFQGISIENPKDTCKNMPIVIAVSIKNQEEIMKYLYKEGFVNYCAYPVFELE
jgi:Glycosyltransferases involved in cell wall biogenesis